jgi:predicted RecB family nuclease
MTGPHAQEQEQEQNQKQPDWVTKTELMMYVRCPYTYGLLHRGEIDRAQLFDPILNELLSEGIRFHEQVEDSVPAVQVHTTAERDLLFAKGISLLHTPMMANTELGIRGRPDGIDPHGGGWWPIEIKSHRRVTLYDKLELAFYWELLAPHRTVADAAPTGIVILRKDGRPHPVVVDLLPGHLEQVHQLIADVRQARLIPPKPRMCNCHVCSSVRRTQVRRSVRARRHVSILFGVGRQYERALAAEGISTCRKLLARDPAELASAINAAGMVRCSPAQVKRWQHHARAFQTRSLQYFGSGQPVGPSFVALDLEYLSAPLPERIWLAGVTVVTDGRPARCRQLWADDRDRDERRLLADLGALLDEHAQLPIVTWAGAGADLSKTSRAARRLSVPDPLAGREHVDMYIWAQANVRLPTPSLTLKELTEYFTVPRTSDVGGGLAAMFLYRDHQKARGLAARAIRRRLLAYNADDVAATIAVTQALRMISGAHADSTIPAITDDSGDGATISGLLAAS